MNFLRRLKDGAGFLGGKIKQGLGFLGNVLRTTRDYTDQAKRLGGAGLALLDRVEPSFGQNVRDIVNQPIAGGGSARDYFNAFDNGLSQASRLTDTANRAVSGDRRAGQELASEAIRRFNQTQTAKDWGKKYSRFQG